MELRLSIEFLERTGAISLFADADHRHPLHHASCPGFWLGKGAAPADLLESAETLLQLAFAEDASDLRMEAGALALFETIGAIMHEPSPAAPHKGPTPAEARLDEVRTAMRKDLAHPWSIAELARTFAINTRRLKEGYRLRFGMPVSGDLQRMRMEGGLDLLRQGHGLMEASLQVGYANPAISRGCSAVIMAYPLRHGEMLVIHEPDGGSSWRFIFFRETAQMSAGPVTPDKPNLA